MCTSANKALRYRSIVDVKPAFSGVVRTCAANTRTLATRAAAERTSLVWCGKCGEGSILAKLSTSIFLHQKVKNS